MSSQPGKSIGRGWFEMQDAKGQIYYANMQTKQTTRERPESNNGLVDDSKAPMIQSHNAKDFSDHPHSSVAKESAFAATNTSDPFNSSGGIHSSGQAALPRPVNLPAEPPKTRRKSKNSSAGNLKASAVVQLAAEPPSRGTHRHVLVAPVETEMESSPFQAAAASDDDSFGDDVPTSFVQRRNASAPAKSLALMLEDTISTPLDDASNQQVAAMRQYFQELDHVSARPVQDTVGSIAPLKPLVPVTSQPPHSDGIVTMASTTQQAFPVHDTIPLVANVIDNFSISKQQQSRDGSAVSLDPPSSIHRVVYDVHIGGATGFFADIVNGVYEPTSEHCCGMTVYRKRDDSDKWLEYSNAADRWSILDTQHRGQVWGWAHLTTHRNIEKCQGLSGWKIADGSRSVDDLSISVRIVERYVLPTDSKFEINVPTDVAKFPHHLPRKAPFSMVPIDSLKSAGSDISFRSSSAMIRSSELSKSVPPSIGLSIIEQLERTLVKHPVASGDIHSSTHPVTLVDSHPTTQSALNSAMLEWYQRNTKAVIRMQAVFRGMRDRKKLRDQRTNRQKRVSLLVAGLAEISEQETKVRLGPRTAHKFDTDHAVIVEASQSSPLSPGRGSVVSPLNPVFLPVHHSSSKNRSAIDAIIRTGLNSDDVDPDQLLLIFKKSKLFKHRKIGEKFIPNASICCELVDFAVINFKLESRDQAVSVLQKLVDSKHLELSHGSLLFKDEHAFVILPHHGNDIQRNQKSSLHMGVDFSVVVESIWRDNNMRIACAIVNDVMNSREPRSSYEGWRSNLHDIAYNKGLRALMFVFLLVHLGLGFYMTRELNWKGVCRNHSSELSRVTFTLYIEVGFCSLYVIYFSLRAIAGFSKSLRRWFMFECVLVVVMCADVGYSLGTYDDRSVPVRFSLPLRALMIACWSNRLRTHLHEIYFSVRKLKVLGGAVLLWIIITATLSTIYVRIVCTKETDEICAQLRNVYFDNAATAMVTLAVMMTTSNYGTISQLLLNRPNQSTTGMITIFVFLIIYMIVSYFLLLSMMLAIVFDAFKKGKRQIMSEKSDIYDAALIGAFSLLCDRDTMAIKHDTYRRFMRLLIPNISSERIKKYWEFLDIDKSGSIDLEEFLELSTIASFQVQSVSLTRIKLTRLFSSLGRIGTGLSFFCDVITSKYFVFISEGVVVANILVVFVSNVLDVPPENYAHPMLGFDSSLKLCQSLLSGNSRDSCQGQVVLDLIEFSFFLFYSLELILRWLAKGMQWILDPWIIFDSAIVLLATASYIVLFSFESNAIDPSISVVFRMLRVVRIIRLFKMSRNLNAFIVTISSIIPGVFSFLCLVLIFVNCFAGLGMLIFQCIDVNPDLQIVNNAADFDTMTGAFMVLFQVLVTADWDSFIWQIRFVTPSYFVGGAVYFLVFYIFVVLLLTNILVSLIIESYGVNLEIIGSGLVNDAVQTQDEGMLLMRYNQSKIIDAKIASFDRQTHRESSQTFQSHKESLKLMQMRAVPSATHIVQDGARQSRGRAATILSRGSPRPQQPSASVTPDSYLNTLQPQAAFDNLPTLNLNLSHVLASQPQQATSSENLHLPPIIRPDGSRPGPKLNSITVPNAVFNTVNMFPPYRSSPALAPRQRAVSETDIYSARWKISATDILHLLQNQSNLIQDVKYRFSLHKSVIIGSELVSYFVMARICSNREDATDLGQHLIMDDILEHEFQEDIFKDKYLFYKIAPNAARNAANIGADSDVSDFEDDGAFFHDNFPQTAKIAIPGHSQLATHLMRKSVASNGGGKDAYLYDAALQDDLVAAAAADRYLADDSASSIDDLAADGVDRESFDGNYDNPDESRDFILENDSPDDLSADEALPNVAGDDSDEEFNRIIASSTAKSFEHGRAPIFGR